MTCFTNSNTFYKRINLKYKPACNLKVYRMVLIYKKKIQNYFGSFTHIWLGPKLPLCPWWYSLLSKTTASGNPYVLLINANIVLVQVHWKKQAPPAYRGHPTVILWCKHWDNNVALKAHKNTKKLIYVIKSNKKLTRRST